MYLNDLIDDYSVNLVGKKVYISVWNYHGVYHIELLKIFKSILEENGFKSLSEEAMRDESSFALGDDYHDSVDNYDFINMEIL